MAGSARSGALIYGKDISSAGCTGGCDQTIARDIAKRLGGEVYPEVWAGPGFSVCNACDSEGNIFQVRELMP